MTVALDNTNYTSIVIYNLSGAKVYSASLDNSEKSIQIAIQNYADGVYYLRAAGSDGVVNVPFVIRH